MSGLKIGTCSWKYDSWRNIVYSDKSNLNFLEEYSKKYKTVEIDQWFWSLHGLDKITLPKNDVVEEYTGSVPADFKFTIKAPNSITLTHFYKKSKFDALIENPHFLSLELMEAFIENLKPMHNQIGMIMFQFEYLNKEKMPSQIDFQILMEDFFSKLDRRFIYGIEIRNPNYLNKAYFEFLNNNDISHVFIQGYYMPSIFEIFHKFSDLINKHTAIRLIGPDRKIIEKLTGNDWSRILLPKDDEIEKLIDMISKLIHKEVDIYLNVNNHYEGSAPLTIERITNKLP